MMYAKRKQYGTVKALEKAILDAYARITTVLVEKDIVAMQKRCLAVIKSEIKMFPLEVAIEYFTVKFVLRFYAFPTFGNLLFSAQALPTKHF